jgi:Rne/Rng family ribonuclease
VSKEICISTTPHETRLAIIEDEQLTEVYYERENEYTLAGSIYKGRVTRVLPGMQSAFVDLGLERDAFLYVTDFLEEQEDSAEFERVSVNGVPERVPERVPESRDRSGPGSESPQVSHERSASNPAAEQFEEGTRRWRGRRGRRQRGGFRQQLPQQGQQAPQPLQEAVESGPDSVASQPMAGRREESAPSRLEAPSFLPASLPGESLSKYGGQAAKETSRSETAPTQSRAVSTASKPSTLIESPFKWDDSGPLPGLLPGESISRYRGGATGEPANFRESVPDTAPPDAASPVIPGSVPISAQSFAPVFAPTFVPIEEPAQTASAPNFDASDREAYRETAELEAPVLLEAFLKVEEVEEVEVGEPIEFELESASASYRVDPSAPSEFRMSAPPPAVVPGVTPDVAEVEPLEAEDMFPAVPEIERHFFRSPLEEHSTPPQSGDQSQDKGGNQRIETTGSAQPNLDIDSEVEFEDPEFEDRGFEDPAAELHDPGVPLGLIEEEELSGEEEYDFTPLYANAEDHDFEEMEEETLEEAMAGAGIDDLVRDTHIEQRVNAEAGDLAPDEEEEDEDEDEPEIEEAAAASTQGQPSAPARQGQRQGQRQDQRRDGRGGRPDRRRHNGRRPTAQTSELPIISELLKQGQEILVQIAKEPIAKKGARITSHIALPGRFLVFMPTVNHIGVSRKISSDEERLRLKRILISEKGAGGGGFIVRTAADGASEEDLRADIRFLISVWTEIKQRADAAKAPALIYHDLNLVERILRDQVSDNFSTIWVDSEVEYERIVRFLSRFQPSLVRRVRLYTKETPLFEQFGIQEEIGKALKSKVWLKSGGSIVINQTEALVAIDINTGKYVGKTARLEDTILKTNLDAIPEIVRQIRLRDLGGIIVIDFIDMDERRNRHKVMQALEEALKADRAPSKVLQFNDFGLVAITRKRVKQSLERTLCVQCNICAGTGMTKSPVTVCNEIYVEMRKMQRHLERHDVLLRVHPEVVTALKSNNARWLSELEEMSGKTLIVKSDPALHPEQFDIH